MKTLSPSGTARAAYETNSFERFPQGWATKQSEHPVVEGDTTSSSGPILPACFGLESPQLEPGVELKYQVLPPERPDLLSTFDGIPDDKQNITVMPICGANEMNGLLCGQHTLPMPCIYVGFFRSLGKEL
jgi:hypothetical protein